MLGHVGRRLRSAGYDTLIDGGKLSDDELLKQACNESRLFLTCDEEVHQMPRGADVLYLPENDEESWAVKLARNAHVDWMLAPFTRCLDCNTQLTPASEEQRSLMPENIKKYGPPGLYCRTCDKLYWEGSHTDRMRARLQKLKDLANA